MFKAFGIDRSDAARRAGPARRSPPAPTCDDHGEQRRGRERATIRRRAATAAGPAARAAAAEAERAARGQAALAETKPLRCHPATATRGSDRRRRDRIDERALGRRWRLVADSAPGTLHAARLPPRGDDRERSMERRRTPAERVGVRARRGRAAPDDRGKHRDLARALERRGSLDELERVLAGVADSAIRSTPTRSRCAPTLLAVARRPQRSRARPLAASRPRPTRRASTTSRSAPSALGDDAVACALRVASAENQPDDADARRARRPLRAHAQAARRPPIVGSPRCRRARARRSRPRSRKLDDSTHASSATSSSTRRGRRRRPRRRGRSIRAASASAWLAGRGRVARRDVALARALGRLERRGRGRSSSRSRAAIAAADPVSGFVNVTAFGTTKRVPFVLTGPSARVARVDARWVSELVPIDRAHHRRHASTFDASLRARAANGDLARQQLLGQRGAVRLRQRDASRSIRRRLRERRRRRVTVRCHARRRMCIRRAAPDGARRAVPRRRAVA